MIFREILDCSSLVSPAASRWHTLLLASSLARPLVEVLKLSLGQGGQWIAVAHTTAQQGPFCQLHRLFFRSKRPFRRNLCQDSAFAFLSMAGLTGALGIGFEELLVTVHPPLVIHRMDAVRAAQVDWHSAGHMAYNTLDQLAFMSLKLNGRHIVICDNCSSRWEHWHFGMGASMASFTEYPGMVILAQPVQDALSADLILREAARRHLNGSSAGVIFPVSL